MKIIISELEKKRILNMHLKLNVNSQSYNINEDYGVESGGGSNNGSFTAINTNHIQSSRSSRAKTQKRSLINNNNNNNITNKSKTISRRNK